MMKGNNPHRKKRNNKRPTAPQPGNQHDNPSGAECVAPPTSTTAVQFDRRERQEQQQNREDEGVVVKRDNAVGPEETLLSEGKYVADVEPVGVLLPPREAVSPLKPFAEPRTLSPPEVVIESFVALDSVKASVVAVAAEKEKVNRTTGTSTLLSFFPGAAKDLVDLISKKVLNIYSILCSIIAIFASFLWGIVYNIISFWIWCFITLPVSITTRLFFAALVWFLNAAPGGRRVLKALNGHVMRH